MENDLAGSPMATNDYPSFGVCAQWDHAVIVVSWDDTHPLKGFIHEASRPAADIIILAGDLRQRERGGY
jgi:hypothetical protein